MKNIYARLILTIFLTLVLQGIIFSQACFIQLSDATGIEYTQEQLDSLEAAACELVQTLPTQFQNDFKVYDIGFYRYNADMVGGVEAVWDRIISEIPTEYYLIFGRAFNRVSKNTSIWLDIKLPITGNFNCYNRIDYKLLESSTKIKVRNNLVRYNYFLAELSGVKYLNTRLTEMIECCQLNLECSECPNSKDIQEYFILHGFDEYDIKILLDQRGKPVELAPIDNPNIHDFAFNVFERDGLKVDPFSEMEEELQNLGLEESSAGVITNNKNLCSNDAPTTLSKSSTLDVIELFNRDYNIDGKILIIVYHLWLNPNGSGDDKLYKKFLWANRGTLDEMDFPLDPSNIGIDTETDYNYELTDLDECTINDNLYEVKKDENGVYHGYELVNCEWQKRDVVEFIEPDPYPLNTNDEQYNIGSQIIPTKTTETRTRLKKEYLGALIEEQYSYSSYFPCGLCYEYTVGSKKDISTNELIRRFYGPYETGWSYQEEKDILFNSFIYGKGQPVVWNANSSISKYLRTNETVSENINRIQQEIIEWVRSEGNLDGLIASNVLRDATNPNPKFSAEYFLTTLSLWPFEMFGGIQGRSVKIIKFNKKPSSTCSSINYECEFVYTLYDNFGLNASEAIWFPGMAEQWTLQHYRNNYCCDYKAFSPVVKHQIEFHHSFEFCK